MANITGLFGFNKRSSSADVLLAAFGNDVINLATGLGYGLALNGNNVEMDYFLDRVFLQNYNDAPLTFNGTVWSKEYVGRTMIAKYQKALRAKSRMYLGNCKFSDPQAPLDTGNNAILFTNRVFYSDFFKGNILTWGLEWGRNGRTIADSPYFTLNQSDAPLVQNFVDRNIKVGDPLFITNGDAALTSKFYTVKRVVSPYVLEMTTKFPVTATAQHYWVGSNWFDVDDAVTGFGENTDNLLVFTLFSLSYYTGTQLRKIKDAPGTSSHRSIINKKGYTYYFHGSDPNISGIYRTDSINALKISRAVDPFILGMNTANYDDVVAWEEGERLRFFVGDLTNTNFDISLTNAAITLDTVTEAYSTDPLADVITAATTWVVSNRRDTYCGTSDSQVLKMQSGNSLNGTPFSMKLTTKVIYPSGSDVINIFPGLEVIGKQTKGVKVSVQMVDDADGKIGAFRPVGECIQDKTELVIPNDEYEAAGIRLRFTESGILENDIFVEKITGFFRAVQRQR